MYIYIYIHTKISKYCNVSTDVEIKYGHSICYLEVERFSPDAAAAPERHVGQLLLEPVQRPRRAWNVDAH